MLRGDVRVDEHLGIAQVRRAIDAIEGGDPDPDHFAVWATAGTSRSARSPSCIGSGPPDDALDRRLGELSGGEVTSSLLRGCC